MCFRERIVVFETLDSASRCEGREVGEQFAQLFACGEVLDVFVGMFAASAGFVVVIVALYPHIPVEDIFEVGRPVLWG